jgi:hypothetical protein
MWLGRGRVTQQSSHGNVIRQPTTATASNHHNHIQPPHPTTHTTPAPLRHGQHPIATKDDAQRQSEERASASETSDDDDDKNTIEREEKQGGE